MRAPFRHRCLDFIIYLYIRDPSPQDESRGLKLVQKSRDRDLDSHPWLEASLVVFWIGPRSDKKNSCSFSPLLHILSEPCFLEAVCGHMIKTERHVDMLHVD